MVKGVAGDRCLYQVHVHVLVGISLQHCRHVWDTPNGDELGKRNDLAARQTASTLWAPQPERNPVDNVIPVFVFGQLGPAWDVLAVMTTEGLHQLELSWRRVASGVGNCQYRSLLVGL